MPKQITQNDIVGEKMPIANVTELALPGVLLIDPAKYCDERGFFSETYNQADYAKIGIDGEFVQDNHSYSAKKGVLRGLHYQLEPYAQGKLVRVTKGAVYDVAVDIRKSSPTFGNYCGAVLSDENWNQLWIPPGFAHGFITLIEGTEFLYKVTKQYSPEHERGIAFDDPDISIDWGLLSKDIQLSDKDRDNPRLNGILKEEL